MDDRPPRAVPHVAHVAAWYPHDADPHLGTFVESHVRSLTPHADCSVIHLRLEKRGAPRWPSFDVEVEYVDERFRVYRASVATPLRRFGVHDYLVRRGFRSVIRRVVREYGPIDLLHVHVRTHITRQVPSLRELRSIPFVLTEHWSFYHLGIMELDPTERERRRREIEDWMGQDRLRFIMPVSEDLAEHLIHGFGAPRDRIRVVPNVADAVFRPADAPPGDGRVRVVLVARWEPPKNPMLFLEALESLPEEERSSFEIDFVGEGSLLAPVGEKAAAMGLARIRLHGFRSKPFVADLMARAHFFVHPTDAENLPTVIIESLCCGTPVLSHAVNGVPELIDDTNGVLCEAGDVPSFAAALRSLLGPYRYDRARIAADARALYSPEAIGRRISEVYHEVLGVP
jgi:glycosyltransferase involved in cell wall biosynthesis